MREFGITVERVRADLDLADLMQEKAELLFIDADFFAGDPCEAIRIMRALVGKIVICVYADIQNSNKGTALLEAGADCVIPKSADERKFGNMLLAALKQKS